MFRDSGFLKELGETHLRDTTGSAIRYAMRETFCPTVSAACERTIFQECPDLKTGNWETVGPGVRARTCALPAALIAGPTGFEPKASLS